MSSSLSLDSAGSGFTTAFITATATGTSTGLDSYDISGSADIATQGSIIGIGRGSAIANGSASYGSQKLGTLAEVWGFASGRSSLSFESRTADSMVSTIGTQNGMHTDSRSIQDILGVRSTMSNSRITSYASTINDARINVSSSGSAISRAWDTPNATVGNEAAASSATGEAKGYVESNGAGDTANSYSVIQSSASSSLNSTVMSVSGGPSAYSSSVQSSNSARTWSESWAKNSSWGSVTRSNTGRSNTSRVAIEYGQLSSLGAGAQVYQSSAHPPHLQR